MEKLPKGRAKVMIFASVYLEIYSNDFHKRCRECHRDHEPRSGHDGAGAHRGGRGLAVVDLACLRAGSHGPRHRSVRE